MAVAATTARTLVTLALKEAGVLGVGQTALAEDMNDSYELMRRMMAAWQKKRWLVPALTDVNLNCNGSISYTIGPGGTIDIPRPNDIKGGYVVQLNTGSTPVSLPLTKIFSYEDYIKIAIKQLPSLPDHFFYDGAWPLGNIFVWPIGNAQYTVHFLVEAQLYFPTLGLDQEFSLPDEYLEAIHYNLAVRLGSMYQLPASTETKRLAKSALNTIRTTNTQVPTLEMPAGLKRGRSFNIYNADGY